MTWRRVVGCCLLACAALVSGAAAASTSAAAQEAGQGSQRTRPSPKLAGPGSQALLPDLPGAIQQQGTSQALRIVLGLTVLAILPALLVCLTSFLRIVIVLSMLRHAIGMPETPPNPVVIGLALFLTLFTMAPVLHQVNQDAFQPFMDGSLGMEVAYVRGSAPLREFMVRRPARKTWA
jgi:flagellar biosynthetic protein FliP